MTSGLRGTSSKLCGLQTKETHDLPPEIESMMCLESRLMSAPQVVVCEPFICQTHTETSGPVDDEKMISFGENYARTLRCGKPPYASGLGLLDAQSLNLSDCIYHLPST